MQYFQLVSIMLVGNRFVLFDGGFTEGLVLAVFFLVIFLVAVGFVVVFFVEFLCLDGVVDRGVRGGGAMDRGEGLTVGLNSPTTENEHDDIAAFAQHFSL